MTAEFQPAGDVATGAIGRLEWNLNIDCCPVTVSPVFMPAEPRDQAASFLDFRPVFRKI